MRKYLAFVLIGISGFVAGVGVDSLYCPEEDSCTIDYRDNGWHVEKEGK